MDNYVVKHRFRLLIAFLLIGILCYIFPYTGDDWAWGSSVGIDRWNTHFAGYGGRYLGYVIVILLTRSRILRALVMSISYLIITICIEYITQKTWSSYLTMTLIAFLPKAIMRQAVAWTSGFSNYVTSTVIMMIVITYLYAHLDNRKEAAMLEKHRILFSFIMLLLGISGTLIVEHITCYMVLLSLVASALFFITEKTIQLPMTALTLGSIIGSIMMFSNSAYHRVATNQDFYRTAFAGGLLTRIVENYLDVIFYEGFLYNICLNIVVFLSCLLAYEKIRRRKKNVPAIWLLLGLIGTYLIISIVATVKWDIVKTQSTFKVLLGALTLIYLAALMLYTCWVGCIMHCLLKLVFPLFSIAIIVSPLFVVNPIGSRCFFPTYVLFILYSQIMLSLVTDTQKSSLSIVRYKSNILLLLAVCLIGYLRLMSIYYPVFICDNRRLESLKAQIASGKQTVEVAHLPNEDYLWLSMPFFGNVWEERYKQFYGLPGDVTIIELKDDGTA